MLTHVNCAPGGELANNALQRTPAAAPWRRLEYRPAPRSLGSFGGYGGRVLDAAPALKHFGYLTTVLSLLLLLSCQSSPERTGPNNYSSLLKTATEVPVQIRYLSYTDDGKAIISYTDPSGATQFSGPLERSHGAVQAVEKYFDNPPRFQLSFFFDKDTNSLVAGSVRLRESNP